jgi:hypothetical protein
MGILKRNIKTGYWVCLDNKPWFPSGASRGEDKRTEGDMREILGGKQRYFKVCRTKPCLMYEWRFKGEIIRNQFYAKWVTDMQKNYNDVIKARE